MESATQQKLEIGRRYQSEKLPDENLFFIGNFKEGEKDIARFADINFECNFFVIDCDKNDINFKIDPIRKTFEFGWINGYYVSNTPNQPDYNPKVYSQIKQVKK
ncbi:hypothetical protein CMI39_03690 [Candidatus Pacearchaeota archaeon]|jgi:hypothetical protein|nr:hypothetical protein [Candidatus Pacearchaeota archaeon]|tara:strand:- start:4343 stop:4654 length:312 start_codon:yes stop_codon:yes gene_type:complete